MKKVSIYSGVGVEHTVGKDGSAVDGHFHVVGYLAVDQDNDPNLKAAWADALKISDAQREYTAKCVVEAGALKKNPCVLPIAVFHSEDQAKLFQEKLDSAGLKSAVINPYYKDLAEDEKKLRALATKKPRGRRPASVKTEEISVDPDYDQVSFSVRDLSAL